MKRSDCGLGRSRHSRFRPRDIARPLKPVGPVFGQPQHKPVVCSDREPGAVKNPIEDFWIVDRLGANERNPAVARLAKKRGKPAQVISEGDFHCHSADGMGKIPKKASPREGPLTPLQGKIAELMEMRQTSRTALARAVGKDVSFIRDFFRGKKAGFSAASILAIARELRADPLELLVLAAADERGKNTCSAK